MAVEKEGTMVDKLEAVRRWIFAVAGRGGPAGRDGAAPQEIVMHFLNSLLAGLPDGLSILDRDLTILLTNPVMEKWYAHAMPLVGRRCFEAYYGRSEPCVLCPTARTLASGIGSDETVPRTGPGGAAAGWFHLYSIPFIKDPATGETLGVIEYVRDISGRVAVEEALRQSEARYRTIFENTGTATIIVEEDATIVLANQEIETLTGFSSGEIAGKKWTEFVHPDDLKKMRSYHDGRRSNPESAPRQYEFRLVDRHGNEKNVINTVSVIPGTRQSVASLLDITRRIQAEQALRISEEKYRLVTEKASDAIFVVQDGVIKFPNPVVLKITGYSAEELARIPFVEHVHPDDRGLVVAAHERRLRGETPPGTYPFRVINRHGVEYSVELSATQILWEGRPATLNMIRDITRQKQLEFQLLQARKMEAVGTLAGGIAHDFNNLLMSIQGYASIMLLSMSPSDPGFEKLKAIERQVQSGAGLTRQLLGFARGGKYEVQALDLNLVAGETARMFGRTKKEIAVHQKFAEGLWPVEADRTQIEQVLLNLFVNAWQAMPSGGEIFLETQNVVLDEFYTASLGIAPGRYVKIGVTDTGLGMDESTRRRIFEPFFTTKEMGRGTGLGLASVYGIVTGHGGIINVYSEKGQGATFTIYLPATDKTASPERQEKEKIVSGTETVLVVEDEEVILHVTKDILSALGYRVLTAQSGREAIELYRLRSGDIRLVILDMIMPGMGGGETFDQLRLIRPDVKVLLASGYSINGQAREIMERGCKGFIQKPFSVQELSLKVREALADKETGRPAS